MLSTRDITSSVLRLLWSYYRKNGLKWLQQMVRRLSKEAVEIVLRKDEGEGV